MSWQAALDSVAGALVQLQECEVRGPDAEQAAKRCSQLERQLWYWRRSVEATYLDRHGDVPHIVARIALQEGVPQVQVLAEMMKEGALGVQWWKLDKYATRHGLAIWPAEEATEGEQDDEGDNDSD